MIVKTIKSFNQFTRHALLERVDGYVNKTKSFEEDILRLKDFYGLDAIYRFDLGENTDGFSPIIDNFINILYENNILISRLHNYPDITHLSIRERLAEIYNIPRQFIVISAGLDSILDLITRTFFEYRDTYLMPVPNFFLFESYSERMGASPIFMQLNEEDNFGWTDDTFEKFKDLIVRFRPKLIWLSNPNNPTGQIIPEDKLIEIIQIASDYNVYVVVDEAYYEFIGTLGESLAKHIHKYPNLMVLRTFSKALGLAGIRLGYLMCSDPDIIDALLLHRHHFPVTQLSLNIAQLALTDTDFLYHTQYITLARRNILFSKLSGLKSFSFVPSHTNIFMLRSLCYSASELDKKLRMFGIITSRLNITGITNDNYLRITIRTDADNEFLFKACQQIDVESLHIS
jgi:histidinol-phosphate aminotransferase